MKVRVFPSPSKAARALASNIARAVLRNPRLVLGLLPAALVALGFEAILTAPWMFPYFPHNWLFTPLAIVIGVASLAVEPYLAQVKDYTSQVTDRAEGLLSGVKGDKRVAKLVETVEVRVVKPVQSLIGRGPKPVAKRTVASKPAPSAATKPATKPAATKPASKPASKPVARKAPAKRATKS